MARYKLYHTYNPMTWRRPHPPWPGNFRHVADVEARDLEEVFDIANHVDQAVEMGMMVCHEDNLRNTCVGDVVVGPDGRAHRCEACGWSVIRK
jgi:hypothetical protein